MRAEIDRDDTRDTTTKGNDGEDTLAQGKQVKAQGNIDREGQARVREIRWMMVDSEDKGNDKRYEKL